MQSVLRRAMSFVHRLVHQHAKSLPLYVAYQQSNQIYTATHALITLYDKLFVNTQIGGLVKKAALLMEAAEKQFVDMLCDETTRELAGSKYQFDQMRPVRLDDNNNTDSDNDNEVIATYLPSDFNQAQSVLESTTKVRERSDGDIVVLGRDNELRVIYGVLDTLVKSNQGSIIYLQGEAGSGKTYVETPSESASASASARVYVLD
jgi:ATP-dependent Clp protease ATP-binding subunit ClpA